MNCVSCNDLVFDFVYGLLDEPEANAVREHVDGCEICSAEMAKAKADQQKISRAALAITEVAPFALPNERVAAETAPLPSAPLETPKAPKRRGVHPVTIIAWAATLVCCAVVAVTLTFDHRQRVDEQESLVAKLSRQHNDVQAKLASLDVKFANEQKRLPEIVSRDALQVHVAGPGTVTPGVSAGFQVAVRNLDGEALSGVYDFEFLDAKNQIVAKRTLSLNGNSEVPVPEELAANHGQLRLRVTAKAGARQVGVVEEAIVSAPPERAAHVALNKLIYKPGDKVQVRALVLDRVTLKPVAAGSKVDVALLSDNGASLAKAELTTFAGIGAGELPLPANLAEGNYTLQARGAGLAPVRRRIEVLPATAPQVELFGQNNFRLGQPITQQMRVTNPDGSPVANTKVFVNGTISEQQGNYGRGNVNQNNAFNPQAPRSFNLEAKTDPAGQLELRVPGIANSQTGSQQLEANVTYGADKKIQARASRELQVQPSQVVVEFLPEGGRLVAGTENRVFYRVRAPEGDASASARVALHSSKETLFDSKVESSFGSFNIKPDANEKYTLKVVSPRPASVADPFTPLGLQAEGLLMHGDALQDAAGPMRLTLENRGRERLVQIVATCRGQVVFHSRLMLKAPQTPLDIAPSVDGLFRVTALEVKDGQLVPLAERLFFRPPSRQLNVTVDAVTVQNPVSLKVWGLDEKKQPLAFWAVGCVVDDRFRDLPEPSLAAHFMLLGEAPTDVDLSDLPIVNFDGPINKTELELTLGVFGWRRVGPPAAGTPPGPANPNNGLIAQAPAQRNAAVDRFKGAERPATDAAGAPSASFFYRVEPSLVELRQKLEEQLQTAKLALEKDTRKQHLELVEDHKDASSRLASARALLAELLRRPREQLMSALGIFALVLLAVGALAMIYGLARLVRHRPAGASFGTACVSLAACLALLVFRPEETTDSPPQFAQGADDRPRVLKEFAPLPLAVKMSEVSQANGRVAMLGRFGKEALERDNADALKPVPADMPEHQVGLRRAQGPLPGEQFAQLEQTRQRMVHDLNSAEGQMRGAPLNAEPAKDRAYFLVPQPSLPRFDGASGGFGAGPPGGGGGVAGGGFGGGGNKGAFAKSAKALPTAPSPQPNPLSTEAMKKDVRGKEEGAKDHAASPKAAKAMPLTIGPRALAKGQPGRMADEPSRAESPLKDLMQKYFQNGNVGDQTQRANLDALTRDFAERRTRDLADPATLLWNPALFIPAAGLTIPIDVPALAARYRVLFLGHTEDGRLGAYDGVLYSK